MKENKRRSIVLIIITISLFLVAVVGATFAYFSTTQNVGANIGTNVQTAASTYSFVSSSNDSIDMSITAQDMSQANVSPENIKTSTGNIDVSLASPNDDTITTCTYDIIWVWDGEDKYTTPDVETLPYTHTDGKVYPYEFSTKVDDNEENDLSKLEVGTTANSVVLQKGLSITSNSTTVVTKTHAVEAKIYNLPVVQNNLFDKKFKAHIKVENVNCTMNDSQVPTEPTLATYITNTVYNSSNNQASIAAGGAGLYKHTPSLANGAGDNSYRYAGADESVHNYACFDGDDCSNEDNLYRIISVDNNNKIKLIKATSLGNMKWNGKTGYTATGTTYDTAMELASRRTYYNIWAIKQADGNYYTSSLNDYLNGDYLANLENKQIMQDNPNLIETTTWSVAGFPASELSKNAKGIYDVETSNVATYDAKVGLMYVYEYMYAAVPEYWTNTTAEKYSASKGNDWMLSSVIPWTISRSSDNDNRAFLVYGYGNNGGGVINRVTLNGVELSVNDYNDYFNFGAVYPSFNLSSSIKIINATDVNIGTKLNPMIIG